MALFINSVSPKNSSTCSISFGYRMTMELGRSCRTVQHIVLRYRWREVAAMTVAPGQPGAASAPGGCRLQEWINTIEGPPDQYAQRCEHSRRDTSRQFHLEFLSNRVYTVQRLARFNLTTHLTSPARGRHCAWSICFRIKVPDL